MKKTLHTLAVIAAVVSAAILWMPTKAYAYAKSQSIANLKGTITIYTTDYVSARRFYGTSAISNVKVANKKIVSVETVSKKKIDLYGKKAGKTTISYTYNGKTHKATVIVKKYAKPVSSIKIGSKNYASKFKSRCSASLNVDACKGKVIKVKPASGWKLAYIKFGYIKYTADDWNVATKRISNGSKIPKVDVGLEIYIVMKNKKTGGYETLSLVSPFS